MPTDPRSAQKASDVTEWRMLRGWSSAELEERLTSLRGRARNFPDDPDETTTDRGWRRHRSTAVVGHEPPGPATSDGPFARGRIAVADYEFSDPRIVKAYFDRDAPLAERDMLLELKVLGLRYLCATRVGAVRHEQTDDETVFGFRYDTLAGHIERGSEWFLLTKTHESGTIEFHIEASWRSGDFPNWWSRLGFSLLAPRYQRRWHLHAHQRLARIMEGGVPPARIQGGRLLEVGPELDR